MVWYAPQPEGPDEMDGGGRIVAIGDIHGCADRLRRLLALTGFRPDDTFVFLGDYINRGPDTKGVISEILELSKRVGDLICLMGNHESLLLEYAETGDEGLIPYLRQEGIEATVSSYGARDLSALKGLKMMPPDHRRFFSGLRLYYRRGGYLFVHAGVVPSRPIEEQSAKELCEIRDLFLETDMRQTGFNETIVFGHTPFDMPLVAPLKIGIDTGAVYGNRLTALVLPQMRFYHA